MWRPARHAERAATLRAAAPVRRQRHAPARYAAATARARSEEAPQADDDLVVIAILTDLLRAVAGDHARLEERV
jgi:hypothetical protein